jgi:hypothetical protein
MRVVPFGPRLIYGVFVAALVPMLPLLLTQMSLLEIVQKIGHALLGGAPS